MVCDNYIGVASLYLALHRQRSRHTRRHLRQCHRTALTESRLLHPARAEGRAVLIEGSMPDSCSRAVSRDHGRRTIPTVMTAP
jgi:hypothetical protein